ncbi:MAG: dienelactone hydrolase family protein [Acidobacteriota bacterium]|nr:dienelactone hydrolase family protein [Acidobacteriota bacterium]MDH3528610.1 dienelactone hydrolase family protein [Acidobacteriota bacterium]
MKSETMHFATKNGVSSAYIAAPDVIAEDSKPVIIIHEWWGLNDQIKKIADRYAGEGFVGVAPDLYRGEVATDPDEASRMMSALAIEDGLDTIRNAIDTVRGKYGFTHFGITGYCMGGTYALYGACELEGISASAPFYGDIPPDEKLKNLNVPVVFISGTRDAWITPEKVAGLEEAADKYELDLDSLKYDADHAFANSARPEVYDRDASEDAWSKVVAFFRDKL